MKIIGLTGSIGMGKSATAVLLRRLKIPVHDSDHAVHIALAPGGAAFRDVVAAFPASLDAGTGRIDRVALGRAVFSDPAKRRILESLIHPHVIASQKAFIRKARRNGFKTVILDIPLLYETKADARVDAVICVTAPGFLQKQRVMRRAKMDEARFRGILASQIPDHEKRRRADCVIHTGIGRAHTLQMLKKYLKKNS